MCKLCAAFEAQLFGTRGMVANGRCEPSGDGFVQSKQLSPRKLHIGSSIIFPSHTLTQAVELEGLKSQGFTHRHIFP